MCSNSEPGRILISHETYKLVKDHYQVTACAPRMIKGKGEMQTYFLDRRLPSAAAPAWWPRATATAPAAPQGVPEPNAGAGAGSGGGGSHGGSGA